MARFQEPGFKTRQAQRDVAKGRKPVSPPIPTPVQAAQKIRAVDKWEHFDSHQPKEAHSAFGSPGKYVEHLKRRGFKTLGQGHYSTVLGKPGSDRVIKVCHRAENDAYPMFAEWCHQNPSPYLPVIHSFKRHERREAFYVVVLDRMAETVGSSSRGHGWREATEVLWNFTQKPHKDLGRIRSVIQEAIFSELPGIKEVLVKLHAEFNGLAHFDMHNENWMLSKSGQLVITDPLSGANSGRSRERNSRVSRIKASMRPAA